MCIINHVTMKTDYKILIVSKLHIHSPVYTLIYIENLLLGATGTIFLLTPCFQMWGQSLV